jgi:hypothetical protein
MESSNHLIIDDITTIRHRSKIIVVGFEMSDTSSSSYANV